MMIFQMINLKKSFDLIGQYVLEKAVINNENVCNLAEFIIHFKINISFNKNYLPKQKKI